MTRQASIKVSLTELTTIHGTYYTAPEQRIGGKYNEKADIYSLGVILYDMLARFPMPRARQGYLMNFAETRTLPLLFRLKYPIESNLILKMTAQNPQDRPSALTLIDEVSRLRESYAGHYFNLKLDLNDMVFSDYSIECKERYMLSTFPMLPGVIKKLLSTMHEQISRDIENFKENNQDKILFLSNLEASSVTLAHPIAAEYIPKYFDDISQKLKADMNQAFWIYNIKNTNYTSVIRNGLEVSEILLGSEYMIVRYEGLPDGFSKEKVIKVLQLSKDDVYFVTVNHQFYSTNGYIVFVSKEKARAFMKKNEFKPDGVEDLELYPIYNYGKWYNLSEHCNIVFPFSVKIASVTLKDKANEALADSVLDILQKVVDVKIEKRGGDPCIFEIYGLKSSNELIIESYLKKQRIFSDISIKPKPSDEVIVSDFEEPEFISVLNKYLSPFEISYDFETSKTHADFINASVAVRSRQVARRIVEEYKKKIAAHPMKAIPEITYFTTIDLTKRSIDISNLLDDFETELEEETITIVENEIGEKDRIIVKSSNHRTNKNIVNNLLSIFDNNLHFDVSEKQIMNLLQNTKQTKDISPGDVKQDVYIAWNSTSKSIVSQYLPCFFTENIPSLPQKFMGKTQNVEKKCSRCNKDVSCDNFIVLNNCNHVVCKECLETYFTAGPELGEGRVDANCVVPNCSEKILLNDLEIIDDKILYRILTNNTIEFIEEHSELYRRCQTAKCGMIYPVDKKGIFECVGCARHYHM